MLSGTYNKGAYGEIYAAAVLTKAGFHVSLPFEQTSAYDLVTEVKPFIFKRCQVKTTTSTKKTIQVKLSRHHSKTKSHSHYTLNDIDVFIVCETNTNDIFVVPCPDTKMWKIILAKDSDNISYYLLNTETNRYASVYKNNWDMFDMTYEESLKLNKIYCIKHICQHILDNDEEILKNKFIGRKESRRLFQVCSRVCIRVFKKYLNVNTIVGKGLSSRELVNKCKKYLHKNS